MEAWLEHQLPGLHPNQSPVDAVAGLAAAMVQLRAGDVTTQLDQRNALRVAHAQAQRRLDDLSGRLPPAGRTRIRKARASLRRGVERALAASRRFEQGGEFGGLPVSAIAIPRLQASPSITPRVARRASVPEAAAVRIDDDIERGAPPEPADLVTEPSTALDAVAAELATPFEAFRWTHDRLRPEVYRGVRRGPEATWRARAANDLDAGWLLVELLRRLGVPARLELARMALHPNQVTAFAGTRDARRAGSVLRGAGVAVEIRANPGGVVTSVHADHWIVRAWLSPGDDMPPTWIHLAPMLKPVHVPAPPEIARPTLDDDLLYSWRSPLDAWTEALGEPRVPASTLTPWPSPSLPVAPPAPRLSVHGLVREPPVGEHQRLVVALDDADPVTVRTADLAGAPLFVETRPATPADAEILEAAGGLEHAPAFAVEVALGVEMGGETLARGRPAHPGEPGRVTITVQLPGLGEDGYAFPVTHGARYAVAVGLGRAPPPPDAGDPLALVGRSYFHRLAHAGARIFGLYGMGHVTDLHLGLVGHEVEVVRAAGLPTRVVRRFVVLDVPRVVTTPFARAGATDPEREAEALKLYGHHASWLEGTVPARYFGGEGWSAQRIIAETRRRGLDLRTLDLNAHPLVVEIGDAAEIWPEVWARLAEEVTAGITLPAELMRLLRLELAARRVARVPVRPLTSAAFLGLPALAGVVSVDPDTGEGAYLIHPALNGGFLITANFDRPLGNSAVSFADIVHLPRCGTRNDWKAGVQSGAITVRLRRLPHGRCAVSGNAVDAEGHPLGVCRHPVERRERANDDCEGPLDGTPEAEVARAAGENVCDAIVHVEPVEGAPCRLRRDEGGDIVVDPEPDYDQCAQTTLRQGVHVVVLLNGRLAWRHYFDFEQVFGPDLLGFAPWHESLEAYADHRGDAVLRGIRSEGGMGFATNFYADPLGSFMQFQYFFDEDPRLTALGRFDVITYPQLRGDEFAGNLSVGDLMCKVARSASGEYTMLRRFRTHEMPGELKYRGIGLDDGRYTHDAPPEIEVPTPGGPLTFRRSYNSSDANLLGPLGPGWRHNHESKVVPTSGGNVVLVRPDGKAVLWRQRHHRGDAERAPAFTFDGTGGERGRLRRYSFEQTPHLASRHCEPRRTGYVYTSPEGVRHHYELYRARARQARPRRHTDSDYYGDRTLLPDEPAELLLTRVRDPAGNGFDYVYDRSTFRLREVLAITEDAPGHYMLRFDHRTRPVDTLLPDLGELEVNRLVRVELHHAAEGFAPVEPEVECGWPTRPPTAARRVLAAVDLDYAGGLPLSESASRVDLTEGSVRRVWGYGYGDFGPPAMVLSRIRDPDGIDTTIEWGGVPSYRLPAADGRHPWWGADGECRAESSWCSLAAVDCLVGGREIDWSGASYLPQAHVRRVREPDGRSLSVSHGRTNDVDPASYNVCAGEQRGSVDVCETTVADTRKARAVEVAIDTRGRVYQLDDRTQVCWGTRHDRVESVEIDAAEAISTVSCEIPFRDDECVEFAGELREMGDGSRVDIERRRGLDGDLPAHGDVDEIETRAWYQRSGDFPGATDLGHEPDPFFERPTRLEHVTDEGVVTRLHHVYEAGLLVLSEGPGGAETRYVRGPDGLGRATEVRTPDSVTRLDYDERFGLPTREVVHDAATDEVLRLSETAYDALGRVVRQTTSEGATIERRYLPGIDGGVRAEDTVQPTVGDAFVRVREEDPVGRLVREQSGLPGHTVRYVYDVLGRLAREVESNPALTTHIRYDARGQIAERTVEQDEQDTRFAYDDDGRLETVTAVEEGAETVVLRQAYDGLGRVVTRAGATGLSTQIRYDVTGAVARVEPQDAPAAAEAWGRDRYGRIRTHRAPGQGETEFAYDALDRLVGEIRPDGVETTFEHREDRSWPVGRRTPALGLTETLGFDGVGRPLSRERQLEVAGRTLRQHFEWRYSAPDRFERTASDGERTRIRVVHSDGLGRVVRMTDGGLEHAYAYDAQGNATRFGEPGLDPFIARYDGRGRMVELTDPTGISTTWSYRGLSQTDVQHTGGTRTHERSDAVGRGVLSCRPGVPSVDAAACPVGIQAATQVAYDGALQRFTDAAGRARSTTYDGAGRPTRLTAAGRGVTTWGYAEDPGGGLRVAMRDASGRVVSEVYDAMGRLSAREVEGAPTLSTALDWNGATLRVSRPGDDVLTVEHDADGRRWRQTRGDHSEARSYDGFGQLEVIVDGSGRTTSLGYDDAGRLARITRPDGSETTARWREGTERVEAISTPSGVTETRTTDRAGRITGRSWSVGPALVSVERRAYDAAGRLASVWRPRDPTAQAPAPDELCPEGATCLEYGADGEVSGATDPGGRHIAWSRDPTGALNEVTVGRQTTRVERDAAGRVSAVHLGEHPPTRLRHDALDRIVRTVDPARHVSDFEWRPDGRIAIARYGRLRVGDDADAEPVPDAVGQAETHFTYDVRGRVSEIVEHHPGEPVATTVGYDTLDRPTTLVRAGEQVAERAYDAAGRLTRVVVRAGAQPLTGDLGYDEAGRIDTLHVTDGDDGERRLRGRFTWSPDGRPSSAHIDGVTACYRYHPDRSLASVGWYEEEVDCAEAEVPEAGYAYEQGPSDGRGQPSWIRQTVTWAGERESRTDRLRYDDDGRLVAWHHLEAVEATFVKYDGAGHRHQLWTMPWSDARAELPERHPAGAATVHRIWHQDATGHLTQVQHRVDRGDLSVDTDDAGHVLRVGRLELPRDARGRPAGDMHDHEGRRVRTGEMRYLRDAAGALRVVAGGGHLRQFLPELPGFQLVVDRIGGRYELSLRRPDGSHLAVLSTDPDAGPGEALGTALYDPFGAPEEHAAPRNEWPRTYGGYLRYDHLRRSPLLLMDAGARLYAPEWGRFLAPDPVAQNPTDPRSADRFGFASADPIRYSDPDGRLPFLVVWAISAAVGVLVDYAMHAGGNDPRPFDWSRSILTNAATGVLSAGVGGLARMGAIARLATRARPAFRAAAAFSTRASLDAFATYNIDRNLGHKTSLTQAYLGALAGETLGAGVGRALGRLRPAWRPDAPAAPHGLAAADADIANASARADRTARNLADAQHSPTGPSCSRCFAAGTLVLTPDGAQPIETLRPGDTVLSTRAAASSAAHQVTLEVGATATRSWRHVQALRDDAWLGRTGANQGWIAIHDGGARPARVTDIQPAPAPRPAATRAATVTATLTLQRNDLVQVRTTSDLLTVTTDHPLWSADRQDWVDAGDLSPGERLRTLDGTATVVRIDPTPGLLTVHNLEVAGDHVFYVGHEGLLAHNEAGVCPLVGPPVHEDSVTDHIGSTGYTKGEIQAPARDLQPAPGAAFVFGSLSRRTRGITYDREWAADVWNHHNFARGNELEEFLANTELHNAGFGHLGKQHGGYFPLVDFVRGTTLRSLKTTKGSKSALRALKRHIRRLSRTQKRGGWTVGGQAASFELDVRVPRGQRGHVLETLEQYGDLRGIRVFVAEF